MLRHRAAPAIDAWDRSPRGNDEPTGPGARLPVHRLRTGEGHDEPGRDPRHRAPRAAAADPGSADAGATRPAERRVITEPGGDGVGCRPSAGLPGRVVDATTPQRDLPRPGSH